MDSHLDKNNQKTTEEANETRSSVEYGRRYAIAKFMHT
ncbi:hypothetical protein PMIT1327_00801 [Prochlorococcus marinus str. MIT 1327]|nr:hypothetical protein PMIT1312_00424 [Prochlorococcus marinus str. MIT 1312]KZR82538.1 hypothetical protein PMIT1327_00801 [Prochlorococcus marinus str. MIT 1327]